MPDTEDKPDPELLRAMESAESQFQEIRSFARNSGLGAEEREMSLLSSGFALGWERHRDANQEEGPHPGAGEGATSQTVRAVSVMNAAMRHIAKVLDQNDIDPMVLSPVTTALQGYIAQFEKERAEHARVALTARFGLRVAALVLEAGDLSDEEALEVGVSMIADNSMAFYGYVAFRDDSRIKCKCPFHLHQALSRYNVTQAQAGAMISRKFASYGQAVTEYGRWYTEKIREITRLGTEVPEGGTEGAIADLMSRLTGNHGGAEE